MSFERQEWRSVIQVVTYATFKRPKRPMRCDVHRFHVWRWRTAPSDPRRQPVDGTKCQCGLLDWTHRKNL